MNITRIPQFTFTNPSEVKSSVATRTAEDHWAQYKVENCSMARKLGKVAAKYFICDDMDLKDT